MKRLLASLILVFSLAACSSGKSSYSVDKFTDSGTDSCIIVTNNFNDQDSFNGVYCKADLTH